MSESLSPWLWKGAHPKRPAESRGFEATTYVEARMKAARAFECPETVVKVRALFDYEIEALRARRAA